MDRASARWPTSGDKAARYGAPDFVVDLQMWATQPGENSKHVHILEALSDVGHPAKVFEQLNLGGTSRTGHYSVAPNADFSRYFHYRELSRINRHSGSELVCECYMILGLDRRFLRKKLTKLLVTY